MRYRAALLWLGLGPAVAFLLLCSCDEVERHRMLTVFFDGVPPLQDQGSGPGLPSTTVADAAGSSQASGWHVHKPLSTCTDCHVGRRQQTSSRQVQLVANVPQLCYGCHPQYASLQGWVHGPVALGECLLCHEPHKARSEFLLVKPVPELCFGCHELDAIRQIQGHAQDSYNRCNDCHEGHSGATKSLLKPAQLKGSVARTFSPEVPSESGASREEAQGTSSAVPQSQATEGGNEGRPADVADRYYSSIKAYHAGQFAEAREGFLEVLKSRSVPEPMREMAKDYLEKIDWVQKEPQLPGWRPDR